MYRIIKAHLHAAVRIDMPKHLNTLLSLDIIYVRLHCYGLLA